MTAACHVPPAAPPAAGAPLTVLLVGRPNAGKSSLYNTLTHGHAHVGNYPGVTVDVLEADLPLPQGQSARLVDLPGTYSLVADVDPDSDEGIARAHIERVRASGAPYVVAQVLDSTNLATNLLFTQELSQLGVPLLLLVTQRDVLEREGRTVDVDAIARAVNAPALWISARDDKTRATVAEALVKLGTAAAPAATHAFDPRAVARQALAPSASPTDLPPLNRLALHRRTEAFDRVLLHPLGGPLAFLALMASLFTSVFFIAEPASAAVGDLLAWLGRGVLTLFGENLVSAFVRDGILAGAGTVVQFLPQIVLLTVALELLEASGYLSRGAFLLDRLLQLFGLGGRSFVPLLMGHACAVPALAATRAIRDPGQRLRTMLVLPLTTCSARIPAYALLIAAFFAGQSALGRALIFLSLYLMGLVGSAVASAVIGKALMRHRRGLPLLIEMPPYRAPELRTVVRVAWQGALRFLREVGTVIVLASAVLWVLLSVPVFAPEPNGARASASTEVQARDTMARSLAAGIGKALEPLTQPLGFDWRINVGLIGSFGARELMVSTMGIIFGIEGADEDLGELPAALRAARGPDGTPSYGMATGLSLMVFFVFACQCLSTVAALRRETRSWRWPLFVLGYTYAVAYLAALAVFQGARALGLS
ncbi:MAG: ferrous iron transporter B [Myxococcales bacterium]|nr:ferrous iron transporter B [Myxococcales bacterium]